jgi:hypothetical protein
MLAYVVDVGADTGARIIAPLTLWFEVAASR